MLIFGSLYLKLKLHKKILLKTFYYNNKATKEVTTSKNYLIKEFTLCLNVMVLNATKLWSLFHFHSIKTFLKSTIFWVLKYGVDKSFTDWFKTCSDAYIFSNPTIHIMVNAPNILCPRFKEPFSFKCNLVSLLLVNWLKRNLFEDLEFTFTQ